MQPTRSASLSFGAILCAGSIALAAHAAMDPTSGQLSAGGSSEQQAALGERFYRLGLGVNGEAVPATVQGDLRVRSTAMPCANCHRRSGWGSAEGPLTVPPVVGLVLFSPVTLGRAEMGSIRTTGAGTRPGYDDSTLKRALRDGIDPAGRPLSATMPRYAVGEADVAALSAHLRSLSAAAPPGVTDTTVQLATITSPAVDTRKREAMIETLRAFEQSKNAGTRNETRRREHGGWDMKSQNEVYRQWMLHEWPLQGNPRDWPAQLAEHYARQPVFAVVSGLVEGVWAPIHNFCEQTRVPCIFPQTAVPPDQETDDSFYSLYFSNGLMLEAATLAHYLKSGPARAVRGGILQVLRCGGSSEGAARQLAGALEPGSAVRTRCLEPSAPLTAVAWRALLAGGADVLVPWLESVDLAGLETLAVSPDGLTGVEQVYLSSSLLGDNLEDLPGPLRTKAFLLHPFVAPDDFDRHARRSLVWLKSRGVETRDRRVSVNAFFAATIVADALAKPRTLASREYFIERVEHMVGRSPVPSAYPAPSLGPQRRFASLGCYVLKIPSEPGGAFTKVGAWSVPELHQEEVK